MDVVELAIGVMGLAGALISFITVYTLRLRQWKEPMYYFIGGLLILTMYQFVAGFELVSSPLIRGTLRGTAETGFAAIITIGIYKMRNTAKTVGA